MRTLSFMIWVIFLFGCKDPKANQEIDNSPNAFTLLDGSKTGIDFENKLKSDTSMNLFKYMYFYNGGGLGVADFNNDGLQDIFFTGNMVENKLYLNKGSMKFEDITQKSGIVKDSSWSNGVSVVDINNDGMMDIYISQLSSFDRFQGHNQLFVCKKIEKGIPVYEEQSKLYGLDFKGYGTHAAFFDYDLDGDLDVYLLNHSTHNNGTFGQRKEFMGKMHKESGDKLYKNSNGKFVDVTEGSGINSTVIGYGLGVVASDVNYDGYPDLYIGNDFHENDYLYINQKNGTFKEELTEQMMHTSRFSMGVDAADLNNDGYNEIISLDMLPEHPSILKRSENDEDISLYKFKLDYGYNYQYSRNALQLNNGNNTFTEIAMYAGVHATDWSWSPLFMDFDQDGKRDLFISNGIPKRMNDLDYINFVQDKDWQFKTSHNHLTQQELDNITKIPEIKIDNKFYFQGKDLKFVDKSHKVNNKLPSYSNGAVYADFDNDGDLDIVTTNINERPFLYQNNLVKDSIKSKAIRIELKGPSKNINGIGTRCIVHTSKKKYYAEFFPVRGFQSSSNECMHVGIGEDLVDSITIVWPDMNYQTLRNIQTSEIQFTYAKSSKYIFQLPNDKLVDTDLKIINDNVGLDFIHKENPYVEFHREPLIPFSSGEEGPVAAVADVNKDGLDDVFFGSSKTYQAQIYLQNKNGKFVKSLQNDLAIDSTYEETDAHFVDVNKDGNIDLLVGSGGNEYSLKTQYTLPRVYLGDGKGNFTKKKDAFNVKSNASKLALHDINNDGYIDIFLASKTTPYSYGELPPSYMLINDKKGGFVDKTKEFFGENISYLIKDAIWEDIDNDKDVDLIIACEWDNLYVYTNDKNKFKKLAITDKKGWWTRIFPIDIDSDGDKDLIVGNQSENTRIKGDEQRPVRMYFGDIDKNESKEQIVSYYLQDKEIPFANKTEIDKKIPYIKKKYLKASDFANATIPEIFEKEKLDKTNIFTGNYFSNCVLINNGKNNFNLKPLPSPLQYSPLTALCKKGNEYLLGMNLYNGNVQMGRSDGHFGGQISFSKGEVSHKAFKNLIIKGAIKSIIPIKIAGKDCFIYMRNNDRALIVG